MIQVMGHSKYFSKNKEFTYETIVETKFMDPSFFIRLNENFTSQHCYKNNINEYKIYQVVNPANSSLFI